MKQIKLGGVLPASSLALGAMRIAGLSDEQMDRLLGVSLENGINFFDHADIYGGGRSEEIFGRALKRAPGLRDKILIQSKCAIHDGLYDFSKEHILSSVDGILSRLGIDYLDLLLLHRPDTLMDPCEVGEAFETLLQAGKVRYFGVSNQSPLQMELTGSEFSGRLIVNQMQMSLANCPMIDAGLNVNTMKEEAVVRDNGLLEYARLHRITLQAWSPLQYGFFAGSFIGSDQYPELNRVLDELAEKYGAAPAAIALAWLLRHPAGIQPILGSASPQHVAEAAKAMEIELTRAEWYRLYCAAGKQLP
jgi:predicted oxidoreductase